jgi:DNA-binding XRE family transcriptional regulator
MSKFKKTGFIDMRDFDWHLGEDAYPIEIHSSLKSCLANGCAYYCGVYEVEVRIKKIVSRERLEPSDMDKKLFDKVGKFLRTTRLNESLSLETLSKKSGVSKKIIDDIENGRRMVSIKESEKLAKHLNVSQEELIQGEQNIV